MLINSSLPNLIGGVNQQPELLHLPGHVKALENANCQPSVGCSSRFGTKHLSFLDFATEDSHTTIIDYGSRGVYVLCVKPDGSVQMFREGAGVAQLMSQQELSKVYLRSTNPKEDIKVVKEGDTVFLLNRRATTGRSVTSPGASYWPALLWIKAGSYGRKYQITIPSWGTAWYQCPDGSNAAQVVDTGTQVIAQRLYEMLRGGPPGSTGAGTGAASWGGPGVAYTGGTTLRGSVISFTIGQPNVTVDDGAGGQYISYVYKQVRTLADLPGTNARDGFYVKVAATNSSAAGSHYLQWSTANQAYSEIANPLEPTAIAYADAMPHTLVPSGSGFSIQPFTWAPRKAGDMETNGDPEFFGKQINDLFFFQDRLGLVSGEAVNFSETGAYGNFYRTTTMDLIDSDPIGLTVTHPKVSTLQHAVPFARRLMLFSANAQFEVTYGDTLTPKTAAVLLASEFDSSPVVRPVGSDTSLFFAADRGTNSMVREYFLSNYSNSTTAETAEDVTAHVPQYIPAGVYQFAVANAFNMLFVVAGAVSGNENLYVYQYYKDGATRLQSAWHRWSFNGRIMAVSVINNLLYLVVWHPGEGMVLEAITLGAPQRDHRLDRSVPLSAATMATTQDANGHWTTTLSGLPYAPTDRLVLTLTAGNTTMRALSVLAPISRSGKSATFKGNLTGAAGLLGYPYAMEVTLGRLMVREQRGSGQAGVSIGRTQLGRMWVNYDGYGLFDVNVSRTTDGQAFTYKSTGIRIGGSATGAVESGPGRFGCPIKCRNTDAEITLVADTPLAPSFLSIDWEGYHVTRGQRV